MSHKPLAFPAVKDFAELFPTVKLNPTGDAPTLYKAKSWCKESMFYLTGYMMVSATGKHYSAHVTPSPMVLEYLKTNVLHCGNDRMYFEVIGRAGGKALVIAQHNVIIGNHWLAEVDAATVPGLVPTEPAVTPAAV